MEAVRVLEIMSENCCIDNLCKAYVSKKKYIINTRITRSLGRYSSLADYKPRSLVLLLLLLLFT
jgi:hypothetical protein